jgi:hypothetical protein
VVEGGGSFLDAPLIAPGVYTDRMRPPEKVFWAFTAQPGQRFTVTAVISGVPGPRASEPGEAPTIETYSPDRVRLDYDFKFFNGLEPVTVSVASPTVGGNEDGYEEGGRYFVSLGMDGKRGLEDRDFPVQLTIALAGEATAANTSTVVAAAATTTIGGAAAATPDDTGDRSLWPERLAGGAAGLVVGFAVTALLARRRRPRRA